MKRLTGRMTVKKLKKIANPKSVINAKTKTMKEIKKDAVVLNAEVEPMQIAKALKDEHNRNKKPVEKKDDPTHDVTKFDDMLDITKPMELVKDMYHTLRKADPTITIELSAVHAEIKKSSVTKWLEDADLKEWFMTPNLSVKESIQSLSQMAVRECRALLTSKSAWSREGIARYLINQSFGKARQKDTAGIPDDENEDLDDDLNMISEIEKNLKRLEEQRDGKKTDKGTIKKNGSKTKTVRRANSHNSGKDRKKGRSGRSVSKNLGRKSKTVV